MPESASVTGVVTRQLASVLAGEVAIVATALDQAMLDHASSVGTARPVEWRQADAMNLPFPDASFDAVVCQFGAMFFPDKVAGYKEARRVLRPGWCYMFNVWGKISDNEFADVVAKALATMFPDDPPRFMERTPHGYNDVEQIRAELIAAGFTKISIEPVDKVSKATAARDAAIALCQGTPLRGEIEARDASRLQEATNPAEQAVANQFGPGAIAARTRPSVLTAR